MIRCDSESHRLTKVNRGARLYTSLMKMTPLSMSVTDWNEIAPTRHAGETGFALWRTQTFDDIRVRRIEYSPGYLADHWCAKGHITLCLSGILDIEIGDGTHLQLKAGQSYRVGDGDPPHRSRTSVGA